MKKTHMAMAFLILFILIFSALDKGSKLCASLGTDNQEKSAECEWQLTAAKVKGSNIVLKATVNKDGLVQLQFPNPNDDLYQMNLFKAKGPADAQGNILICAKGQSIYTFGGSSKTLDPAKDQLTPGFYAVQVIVGDPNSGKQVTKSDWIIVQIK